jgi:4-hydroxy 2-oxovalerate aldolase
MKILDVTLRDGGYLNNWAWDFEFMTDLIRAVARCGVDIVELGYRSPRSIMDKFGRVEGEEVECRALFDDDISCLPKPDGIEFAVMVDAREYKNQAITSRFGPAEDSLVDLVRVATTYEDMETAIKCVSELKYAGYKVSFNLMRGSALKWEQIKESIDAVQEAGGVDIYYIADSFGHWYAKDLLNVLYAVSDAFGEGQALGFHGHDNRGYALANATTAAACGIEYIDSSVAGLGRGAGNVCTEELLDWDGREFWPLLGVLEKTGWTGLSESNDGTLADLATGRENLHPNEAGRLLEERKKGEKR